MGYKNLATLSPAITSSKVKILQYNASWLERSSLQMYHFTRFLTALYLALTLCATIGQTISSQKFTLGSQFPPAFKARSPNVPAAHVLTLNIAPGASRSAGYIQSLRDGQHINGVYGLTPVNYVAADNTLVAYLEIGTQSFQAQIDTGSSDTWTSSASMRRQELSSQKAHACSDPPTPSSPRSDVSRTKISTYYTQTAAP